mmetsp:Transcript_67728/g.195791  ORF Transcript_67728/g.195791 Transcript_67728/m.195791 type:complete len:213 (-) Transcript_67728:159-797(-)
MTAAAEALGPPEAADCCRDRDASSKAASETTPSAGTSSGGAEWPSEAGAAPAEEQRAAFVPHWPYSSQWPFCRAPTTLELKHLPGSLTLVGLLEQINNWGLADRCNYVWLGASGSCALINTERHVDGRELAGKLHQFRGWNACGEAPECKVSWCFAKQGLDELMLEQHISKLWHDDGTYAGGFVFQGDTWLPAVPPPQDESSAWAPMWYPIG